MVTSALSPKASLFESIKNYTGPLKDVVVLVPAVHLSLCFIYLYLYFVAFGGSLALFTSPTDVFSVSFLNIAPFYAGLILQPILVYIPIWNSEAPKQPAKPKPMGLVDKIFLIVPFALGLPIAVTYYAVTGFFPVAAAFFVSFWAWYWGARTYLRRRRRPLKAQIVVALGMAMLLLSFNAVRDGQRDRYGDPSQFRSNALCGQYSILRTLGDRFLAVDRAGKRVIIDNSCSPRFLVGVANPRYFPDNDWAELARRVRHSFWK